MLTRNALNAVIDGLESLNSIKGRASLAPRLFLSDTMPIIAIGFLAALLLFGWAKYWRKGSRQRSAGASSLGAGPSGQEESEGAATGRKHRRRRRARREHRPRNPTLAETGGLPPDKPGGSLPAGR